VAYLAFRDFLLEVDKGLVPGHSLVRKFGASTNITSTLSPVAIGEVYQTPTTAASLELVSDDAADTAAGAGAQTVEIQGLDANFELQTQMVSMNGITAVAVPGTWVRVFRMLVATSGSYASLLQPSHVGNIDLQGTGGGVLWARIHVDPTTGFSVGQTEIGAYTIPAGYTGYLLTDEETVETGKQATILWFRRESADDVTTPYDTLRLFSRQVGVVGSYGSNGKAPLLNLPQKTDIGAMAWVPSGTSYVSVNFQILLVENP